MKTILWMALLALVSGPVALADSTHLCSADMLGFAKDSDVRTAAAGLYSALKSGKQEDIEPFVGYLLKINSDKGTFVVKNRKELEANFSAIFRPDFRKGFKDFDTERTGCTSGLMSFEDGTLWTKEENGRLVISVINDNSFVWPSKEKPSVYKCTTSIHRVVIDKDGSRFRYRSWDKSLPDTSGKPSLSLEDGKQTVDGTGPCEALTWTFKSGGYVYALSERPCTESAAPQAAALLTVSKDGKQLKSWGCTP